MYKTQGGGWKRWCVRHRDDDSDNDHIARGEHVCTNEEEMRKEKNGQVVLAARACVTDESTGTKR